MTDFTSKNKISGFYISVRRSGNGLNSKILSNISFSGSLYDIEMFQLISDANQSTGFFTKQAFTGSFLEKILTGIFMDVLFLFIYVYFEQFIRFFTRRLTCINLSYFKLSK